MGRKRKARDYRVYKYLQRWHATFDWGRRKYGPKCKCRSRDVLLDRSFVMIEGATKRDAIGQAKKIADALNLELPKPKGK